MSEDYLDTPGLGMLRNVIRDYLAGHSPPIVIQGEPGAGKTALLRRLMRELGSDFDICSFAADRPAGAPSLHKTILRRWLPDGPLDASTRHLFQHLCDTPTARARLLLIDDAERLSRAEIKGVLGLKQALAHYGGIPLGLVLCGNATLEPRVAALAAEVTPNLLPVCLGLRPFTRQESEQLARNRGYEPSPTAMARLHRSSGGLPGQLVHQLGDTGRRHTPGTRLLRLLRLFAVGAIAAALLLPSSPRSDATRTQSIPLPPETASAQPSTGTAGSDIRRPYAYGRAPGALSRYSAGELNPATAQHYTDRPN
ncbi:ATP-binding protein [Acidihalobacter prosperus]|nr:ATP-binding protein [Acidihalobacter prosperus]